MVGRIIGYVFLGIAALIVLFFVFMAVIALFVNPKKEYTKDSPFYRWVLNWTTAAFGIHLMRIRVHVTGKEKVPKDQKMLFVGNHRSNFDPIITWYVFKDWKLAYTSKAGNFKIPFWGQVIRKCCFMEIDRENPRKAVKTVIKAGELLKAQEVSIGTYPEGTRNKSGEGLLPFHNGVFKIAQKGEAPIVVVALRGTEKIAKNYPFHHTDVYMDIVEVIPKEDVVGVKTSVIGERVREGLLKATEEA